MVEAHFHVSILKTSHEHMEMIRTANVVLGVDAESGDPSGVFFYGVDEPEFIADAGLTSGARVVRVAYDAGTQELEYLCSVVQVLKGRCDYQRSQEGYVWPPAGPEKPE